MACFRYTSLEKLYFIDFMRAVVVPYLCMRSHKRGSCRRASHGQLQYIQAPSTDM